MAKGNCTPRSATATWRSHRVGEIWALRYTLLNLFYENAKAASDGIRLLPDSIAKIRDHADELKLPKARRILEDFVSRNGSQRSQK